ncbi:MAG: metal-binding protein [Hydrococcus sp. RM1_1_31]|nr:metal-binding protein [Hydrococcus sp. RM1_1_31]
MPSGRTHDRITFWCLPAIVGFSYLLTQKGELTLIVASAFLFGGLMFGPDLDIYSVQFKRWGILRWLWLPYQKFLKHRSQLSHGLIIGTTLRIIYLLVCLLLAAIPGVALAQLIFGFDWNWQHFARDGVRRMIQDYPTEAIALTIGLELGAMSHYLSDSIGSALKKQKTKGKSKK